MGVTSEQKLNQTPQLIRTSFPSLQSVKPLEQQLIAMI